MKPSNQQNMNLNQLDSLEKEAAKLLDQSVADMPAELVSRMRAAREVSLDSISESGHVWFKTLDWRPTFATVALCLLAVILLYIPNVSKQPEQQFTQSWLVEDEYLLGDDLSLYLWLTDTTALSPNDEG